MQRLPDLSLLLSQQEFVSPGWAVWEWSFHCLRRVRFTGVVAHACNPSYSRFEASPGKKLARPPSQPIKLDVVVLACHLNYTGGVNGRISGPGWPEQKH
jgi:hypothetical protein